MKTLDNNQRTLKLNQSSGKADRTPKPRIGDDDGISNRTMNILLMLFMLLTMGISFAASAETDPQIKYRILLRQAMLDYERMDYYKAISKLLEVVDNTEENANVFYMLGVSYLYGQQNAEKAEFYLNRAAESVSDTYMFWDLDETNAPPKTLYCLAKAYEELEEFAKASVHYEQYLVYMVANLGTDQSKTYAMIKSSAMNCQLAAEQSNGASNENIVLNK